MSQTNTAPADAITLPPGEVMKLYLTEGVNKQQLDLIPSFTADEMVDHTQPGLTGPAALDAHVRMFCGNIPDLQVEVVEVIATDDAALGVWRWSGTPTQPIWGSSPTGKPVIPRLIASLFKFRDGQLVEYRAFTDAMEIIGQLTEGT